MRNDSGAHFVGKADDYRGKILPLHQGAEEKRKLIQPGDLFHFQGRNGTIFSLPT